jgi:uncharacterized protein (TIGR02391 family)
MAKDRKRFFTQGQIEQVSKILAECLTGSEIGHLLISVGIADVDPNNTKWKRLFNAFVEEHNRRKSDNYLLNFIARALEPSRFVGKSTQYGTIIDELNVVLSFQGLMFLDDGKFHTVKSAETLSEAEKRVSSLKRAITERNLHPELMKYCRTELVQDNYFHAVLEAVKGISSDIRNRTGLTSDGAELVDSAFAGTNPLLRINRLVSDTEKSEQKGFINLLKGLLGTFRNPTAHAAKIEWKMDELDALDLFTMASYAYRRIGSAVDRP